MLKKLVQEICIKSLHEILMQIYANCAESSCILFCARNLYKRKLAQESMSELSKFIGHVS